MRNIWQFICILAILLTGIAATVRADAALDARADFRARTAQNFKAINAIPRNERPSYEKAKADLDAILVGLKTEEIIGYDKKYITACAFVARACLEYDTALALFDSVGSNWGRHFVLRSMGNHQGALDAAIQAYAGFGEGQRLGTIPRICMLALAVGDEKSVLLAIEKAYDGLFRGTDALTLERAQTLWAVFQPNGARVLDMQDYLDRCSRLYAIWYPVCSKRGEKWQGFAEAVRIARDSV